MRDAWNYYLEHDNRGRGFVLIGHSQGSFILAELIRKEIDGKPVQSRMVSAILLGTTLAVPRGKDVGGAFQHVPLCRSASQTGCVITYASFRSTVPPPADTLFGKVPVTKHGRRVHESRGAWRWQRRAARVSVDATAAPSSRTTPPEAVGDARAADRHAVGQRSRPADGAMRVQRERDLSRGDRARRSVRPSNGRHHRRHQPDGQVLANWGLHLIDVNLALGNLVDIVGQQAKAWVAQEEKAAQSGK